MVRYQGHEVKVDERSHGRLITEATHLVLSVYFIQNFVTVKHNV